MRIDIWSDLVCPWCYIGKRRFERALSEFEDRDGVEVVHRAFQLDPAIPRGQTMPRREVLMAKYGWSAATLRDMDSTMKSTAAAEGLDFRWEDGVSGNTTDAHRIVHLARERGLQDAMVERLLGAHFTENRSIFDDASLADLAAEVGLDRAEAVHVLQRGGYADSVTADLREAAALGITGVPFFAIDGRFGVSGAQSPDVFTGLLHRASQQPSTH